MRLDPSELKTRLDDTKLREILVNQGIDVENLLEQIDQQIELEAQ